MPPSHKRLHTDEAIVAKINFWLEEHAQLVSQQCLAQIVGQSEAIVVDLIKASAVHRHAEALAFGLVHGDVSQLQHLLRRLGMQRSTADPD